jgi:hypothetical protein
MFKGRTIFIALTALLIFTTFCGCKKSQKGSLVIKLNPTYNGQYFALDTFNTDPAGNVITVSNFLFYLSNITLVKTNNETVNVSAVNLFDLSNPSTLTVQLNNISAADFKAITFGCGVDSAQNTTNPDNAPFNSPLGLHSDPTENMYWSMLGYRFEVFEGSWATSKSGILLSTNPLIYHVGGNTYFRQTQLNQNFSVGAGNTTTLNLNLDVEKIFYAAADTLSIVTEFYTTCAPTDNPAVAPAFVNNFSQAFNLSQ